MEHKRLVVSLALLLVPAFSGHVLAASPRQAPEHIELRPASVIHGEVSLALLSADHAGDLDGDGAADLVFDWFPTQTRYAYQDAVAMGRTDWPARAGLSRLARLHSLGFPTADDWSPNSPVYWVQDVVDISGDGLADLVVRKNEFRGGEPNASEARIYFGHADWGPLDVRQQEPDLLIRQARVPWTPSEAGRFLMPDTVFGGDFNGDGRRDLAIGSCGVAPRAPDGTPLADGPSPLQLFLAPPDGLRRIDLGTTKPSVEIQGLPDEQVGCVGRAEIAADVNGDELTDLLLHSGATVTSLKVYLAFGRATWPARASVAEVGTVVIDHKSRERGVEASVMKDITGDGRDELITRYHDDAARRYRQCVWYGGQVFTPKQDVTDCDIRLTDELVGMVGDVTGDGLRDLIFWWPTETEQLEPEYRIVAGPLEPGTELAIGPRSGAGDYVIRLPEPSAENGNPDWLFADLTGDGREDLILHSASQNSPDGVMQAGVVQLHIGPLVKSIPTPLPPTASATARATTEPSPQPTATRPPPTHSPEPTTPAPPTATATGTTTAPTEGSGPGRLFLPVAFAGRWDD